MQEGQKQFFEFMVDRIVEDKKQEGISLLEESFKMQNSGGFSKERLEDVSKKLLEIVKPECKEEVQSIFEQFGQNHIS